MERSERVVAVAAWAWRIAADFVAPVLLVMWLTRHVGRRLLGSDDLVAAPMYLTTGDPNGQAWFYWWLQRAVETGADLENPDVVCAPDGIALGHNFATRVDAWLALPFFAEMPFPASFNAAALAVPACNTALAWIGLRAAKAPAPVALLAAALIGFSEYALFEVGLGHNANALVGPAVLLLGAWSAVAEGRWGWAPVAAAAAAVTFAGYPPYAVVIAPVGALLLLGELVGGRGRRVRILLSAMVTAAAAGIAAFAHLRALQERGYAETEVGLTAHRLEMLMRDSLPWRWLWESGTGFNDPHVWTAPALWMGAALALLGGWRGRAWLAAGVAFWVLALGVVVLDAPAVPTRVEGKMLGLPLRWLVDVVPPLVNVRPYRFAPLVAAAAALALGAFARWGWEGRERSGWPRVVAWAPTLLATALAAHGLRAALADHMSMWLQPWRLPPAVQWLADTPGDFAIIELPAGLGHAYGALQPVHGKRRSEGHHDVSMDARRRTDAPTDCYTTALVRGLWSLERGVPYRPTEAELAEAEADGFRYVVVYGSLYTNEPGAAGLTRPHPALREMFGEPVVDEGGVAIYAIRR